MTAFQQISHDSQNLLDEEALSEYVGAVLSPVNYTEAETEAFTDRLRLKRSGEFDFVFDPQLYFPESERTLLRKWPYFPNDFDSGDRGSLEFWAKVTKLVVKAGTDLRARQIASPADVAKIYDNGYFERLVHVGNAMAAQTRGRFEAMQTVIVPLRDLAEPKRAMKIASIVSATKCPSVYVVLETDQKPRSELDDSAQLLGVMQLIHALGQHFRIMVAYSSSDVLLWKTAGAAACATGKYFNVRRFSPSRWKEKMDGGGTVEYWFEESLLAFVRQDDLLRLSKEGMLSKATIDNPLFHKIMEAIADGKAWFRLSWIGYMYWFADIERRLSAGEASAEKMLVAADLTWKAVDAKQIFLVERSNTGEWIGRWRQAVADFGKWKQERSPNNELGTS